MNTLLQSSSGTFIIVGFFAVVILWSLFWKGWALWTAARHSSKPWFIALLIVNTLGILEIFYIFFIARKRNPPMVAASPFPAPTQKPPIVVR